MVGNALARGSWEMTYDAGTGTLVARFSDVDSAPETPAWVLTEDELEAHDREVVRHTRRALLRRVNSELDALARDGRPVSWAWLEGITRVRELIDPEHPREQLWDY